MHGPQQDNSECVRAQLHCSLVQFALTIHKFSCTVKAESLHVPKSKFACDILKSKVRKDNQDSQVKLTVQKKSQAKLL